MANRKQMTCNSFEFYSSFYEAISVLPAENQAHIYDAIFKFAFEDTEIELEGAELAVFLLIKPQLIISRCGAPRGNKNARKKTEENNSNTIENNSKTIENNSNTIENNSNTIENNSKTIENNSKTIENNSNTIENNSNTIENNSKTTMVEKEKEEQKKSLTKEKNEEIEKEVSKKENKEIYKNNQACEGAHTRESYQDIIDTMMVEANVQPMLWKFIQHCQLNGKMLTNKKLEDILVYMDMSGYDDKQKIQALKTAINGGYYDIKRGAQ